MPDKGYYIILLVVAIGGICYSLYHLHKQKQAQDRLGSTTAYVVKIHPLSFMRRSALAAHVSYKVDDVKYQPKDAIQVPPGTMLHDYIKIQYYLDDPGRVYETSRAKINQGFGFAVLCVVLAIIITV